MSIGAEQFFGHFMLLEGIQSLPPLATHLYSLFRQFRPFPCQFLLKLVFLPFQTGLQFVPPSLGHLMLFPCPCFSFGFCHLGPCQLGAQLLAFTFPGGQLTLLGQQQLPGAGQLGGQTFTFCFCKVLYGKQLDGACPDGIPQAVGLATQFG